MKTVNETLRFGYFFNEEQFCALRNTMPTSILSINDNMKRFNISSIQEDYEIELKDEDLIDV